MIPYSTQDINESDIQAVVRVLRSRIITRGPVVAAFEKGVAQALGAKFAVAFSSGTAALHGAYVAAGVGQGDEVITSPLTFAATANAALWQGAKVVFADVDAVGNLDPRAVAKKITKRTKAIAVVDYGGYPADLDAFRRLARAHKLVLIEDAVHALGAVYKNKKIGSISDISVFSFHPVKPITAGEAGVVTTNSVAYYQTLLRFRNHGMTRDRTLWQKKNAPEHHYEMLELGLNYWLSDIQAALGLSQLRRLNMFRKKRAAKAVLYTKALKNLKEVSLPPIDTSSVYSGWHLYAMRLTSLPGETLEALAARRDALFAALRARGIGVQVHYMPVYWHPYYQKLGYVQGLCPNAEKFFAAEISLPLFPALTTKQQQYIIKSVQTLVRATS